MSERREFYAGTIDEAVDKASTALGVAREQLDFEVLDRGSAGFLGLGVREARISVEQSGVRASEPATDEGQVTPTEEERLHAEETKLDGSPPAEALEASEAPQDLILAADEFCTKLLSAMGLDGTVDAYDGGEVIVVDLTAKETGLLIGQKGETLDAMQYLLNLAIYKNRPFLKRIVVDSEGYRQRRAEAIRGMANRTARRVVREQRPLDLPPMSAAERRVVHLFLQENPGVSTSSKGKGEERRVVVRPA